jgi:outer membrane receptor protein involved in Fe transport
MKTKLTLAFLLLFMLLKVSAQERPNLFFGYNLYQFGSASYTHVENGNTISDISGIKVNHFLYDIDVAIGNTYIRLDVSSVAGTFLDGYLGGDEKDFLQPFQLGVGYVTYNSPIEITTNSDLAIGASVFINSTLLSGPALGNGKEDFGTYGYSIIADYQLDDYLNVFAEYSRGKRNEGEAADRIREFRVRAAYNIYNGIYVTLSSNLKKYTDEGPDYKKEVGATTFSIGLLFR